MSQVNVSMLNSYREIQEEAKRLGLPYNLKKEDLLNLIICEVEKNESKKRLYIEISSNKKKEDYRRKRIKRRKIKKQRNENNFTIAVKEDDENYIFENYLKHWPSPPPSLFGEQPVEKSATEPSTSSGNNEKYDAKEEGVQEEDVYEIDIYENYLNNQARFEMCHLGLQPVEKSATEPSTSSDMVFNLSPEEEWLPEGEMEIIHQLFPDMDWGELSPENML